MHANSPSGGPSRKAERYLQHQPGRAAPGVNSGLMIAMVVQCTNCGTNNTVSAEPPPPGARLRCGKCGAFLAGPRKATGRGEDIGTRTVAGATGGALLGWSIGGPPGAVIGGLLGGLIGAKSGASGE